MKRFLLVLILLAAGARAEETKPFEPKLHAGDWNISGSISFTANSFSDGNSSLVFSASLPLQYFVADGVSIGGALLWSTVSNKLAGQGSQTATVVSFGPEVTWYFWRHERLAAFVVPEFFVNVGGPDRPNTFSAAGAVGFDWFFNPSVAAGPGFLYRHQFGSGVVASSDSYRVFAQLFVYL